MATDKSCHELRDGQLTDRQRNDMSDKSERTFMPEIISHLLCHLQLDAKLLTHVLKILELPEQTKCDSSSSLTAGLDLKRGRGLCVQKVPKPARKHGMPKPVHHVVVAYRVFRSLTQEKIHVAEADVRPLVCYAK